MAGTVIPYKPPPTVREFILDYQPGKLFYDWVVGPVGCLPGDSEFLTPRGWKRMDAYIPGDQVAVWRGGVVHFEAAKHIDVIAEAPFYRFDSGSLEMELSPAHRVLYVDYRGCQQIKTAANLAAHPSRATIPTTWALSRGDAPMTEAEIRLRVAFSADGHIPVVGSQQCVTLRKERKKIRLRTLLLAASVEWTETCHEARPTETIFKVRWAGADKSLNFVWELSSRQLEVVLDECFRWDGLNDHAEKRYYSTIREHADAVQFAAHSCGYRARIRTTTDPRNLNWASLHTVQVRAGDNPKNRAMVRECTRISRIIAPGGRQYCFETSTGAFVTRCNGTVFITGNSGKTTGLFFKLVHMASLQAPDLDGIKRTRAVVVRNTLPQLRDTTLVSWNDWFKDGTAGKWRATEKNFDLKFGNVECEVLFRPLDTPADVARVLSLEVTFAIIDEFVKIPRDIIEALSARLGRWPRNATNWGMWGSSNPDNEDNWWYDYLFKNPSILQMPPIDKLDYGNEDAWNAYVGLEGIDLSQVNARFFQQPGGFAPNAENLRNLPPRDGSNAYYTEIAKGKPDEWVKQFIDAEWGYSAEGKPVVPTFRVHDHVTKGLKFNPSQPLIIGFDPGLGGSAFVFGQEDLHGRLLVLAELCQEGFGSERLITERLKPFLRTYFPNAMVIIAPDPASANRSPNDETEIIKPFKDPRNGFVVEIETNNRLPLRLDAIESYTMKLTSRGPALQIDGDKCPRLIRALKGGWRYVIDQKRAEPRAEPEKNPWSHVGDGFGYLARYFHRANERYSRYNQPAMGGQRLVIPRKWGSPYHCR